MSAPTGPPGMPDLSAGQASPPRPRLAARNTCFLDEAAGLAAAFKAIRAVFDPYFSAAPHAARIAGFWADARSADEADAEASSP